MSQRIASSALSGVEMKELMLEAEKRVSAKRSGYTGGVIASILAILSIFLFGVIFLPIAILIAFFSTLNALMNGNVGGFLFNILAWVLILIGASTSPVFLGLVGLLGLSSSNIDFKPSDSYSHYSETVYENRKIRKKDKNNETIESFRSDEKFYISNNNEISCEEDDRVNDVIACIRAQEANYSKPSTNLSQIEINKYKSNFTDIENWAFQFETGSVQFFCTLEQCVGFASKDNVLHIANGNNIRDTREKPMDTDQRFNKAFFKSLYKATVNSKIEISNEGIMGTSMADRVLISYPSEGNPPQLEESLFQDAMQKYYYRYK